MINVLIDIKPNDKAQAQLEAMPGIKTQWLEPLDGKKRSLSLQQLRECNVLLCATPPENHQEMQQLRYLQISSAGYKQLIGQNFENRDVRACNALGVFDISIAEWNLAMMVNLARDLRGMIRNQEQEVWDRSARHQHEIRGMTVCIWGYGGIGRETARLCKAMGMRVHVLTRSGVKKREKIYCVPGTGDPEGVFPDRVYLMNEKEAFLKSADFLILAIPETPETEGIIDEGELKMLRPEAYLLNPARGPLIAEKALITALKEKWIAGAAIDTHYYYPMPKGHPLWSMPNVIFTPHIAGSNAGPYFLERIYGIFLENLRRFQAGEPLLNQLSREQLAGR